MIRRFSFYFVLLSGFFLSPSLWAEDYVVVVENGDAKTDYTSFDDSTTRVMADRLDVLVKEIDEDIRVKVISVNALENLEDEFDKHFGEGDHVKALVFSGHGNETLFTLNSKKAYSGRGFAKAIEPLLSHNTIKESVLIYMASCLNACPVQGQLNFQEKMMDTLRERLNAEDLKIVSLSHTRSVVVHTLFGSKDLSFRQKIGRKLHRHFFKYFGRNDLSSLYAGLSSSLALILLFGYLPAEPSPAGIIASLSTLPVFLGFGLGTSTGNIEVEQSTLENGNLDYQKGESGPLTRSYFEVYSSYRCERLF